ncbi:MAG: DivIVA domain-containing protein [Actinobacteria bacterium]|nr:DivIVA domain-containing protein [Actinomycetota bacterium]
MEPEEIESKEFLVSLRGYDREEVDAYLRELADEIRRLSTSVGTTAAPPSAAPTGDPATFYKQIGDETSKILLAAEEAGREINARARAEAAELLSSARSQAEEIRKLGDQQRQAAEDDLRRLREARSILATQLEDVRRRLDETIARLQAPIETPTGTARTETVSPSIPQPTTQVVSPRVEEPEVVPEVEPEVFPEVEPEVVHEVEPEIQEPVAAAPLPSTKVDEAPPEAVAEPEVETPGFDQQTAVAEAPALEDLLREIREERERGRREVEEALRDTASEPTLADTIEDVVPDGPAVVSKDEDVALSRRGEVLQETPIQASRRLKRLLQEDQNDLLDRIRTHRGKGTFDQDISPLDQQESRFAEGMGEILGEAFSAGRKVAGGDSQGEPDQPVRNLVSRQLVGPLRRELSTAVEAGLQAQDTPTSIAERASDIYRVWKGVRTELLGEGLVFAAYHQGLMDVWRSQGAATKRWVLSLDEQTCPRDVCRQNEGAGAVAVDSAFPSGHMAPPAHGGCTCTMSGSEDSH